jgi:hypothetical protein
MYPTPPRKSKTGRRRDGRSAEPSEYYCSSYHAKIQKGTPAKCRRNSVDQDELAEYVNRYLEEAGKRLDLLTKAPAVDPPIARKEREEEDAWGAYQEGLARLCDYLAKFHPEEYNAILREDARLADEEDAAAEDALRDAANPPPDTRTPEQRHRFDETLRRVAERLEDEPVRRFTQGNREGAFVAAALDLFRARFDPEAVAAEIKRLDAQHTELTAQCRKLEDPRAIAKTNAELKSLSDRIADLERQQRNIADEIVAALRAVHDLRDQIYAAQKAMRGKAGERALRERAERLRGVLHRIECRFVATDRVRGGWGTKSTRLVSVRFVPYDGKAKEYRVPRREKASGAGAVKPAPV